MRIVDRRSFGRRRKKEKKVRGAGKVGPFPTVRGKRIVLKHKKKGPKKRS